MADKRVKTIKHNNVSVKFEVDSRYSPLESIGTGAYGVVCAAMDNRTGLRVAIKKVPKIFEITTIAKRTYRELKILRHLRHENIISILDVMQPPEDRSAFEDVYIVLDLMESDLHHIVHSVQPLSDEHIKYFLYQILRGLKYIHSASILHRDLKPSNLLVNSNCELKIGDFGMARGLSSSPEDHATFMTEYVATRWYRAPELMLSVNEYTFAIDIWSVGCIFAEMLARRHLFPGKDYLNQLQLILSVVGTPSEDYISHIGSDRVKSYLSGLPPRQPVSLSVLFPSVGTNALALLGSMLQLDPKMRTTPEGALGHDYLSRYHDPDDEPVCNPPFDFKFEKELVSKEDLQRAIVEEIMDYHKCRLPIPSQETVKDALKKLMEDREKEKGDGEPTPPKDSKDTKETPQRRAEDKKRKGHHHYDSDRKKRAKPHPTTLTDLPPPPEHLLTDHDKNALDRWKRIQQTNNASGGGRGTGGGGAPSEETLKQLEQLQGQVGELKKMEGHVHSLQRQLADQQRVNREQGDLIQRLMEQNRQLQQHNLLLAQRCQEAGLTSSPSSSLSDSMATTPGGERPGSGGRQSTVMVGGGGFGGASLHSFPGTTPPYPTTNPVTPPNRQMGLQHMGGSMLRPSYSTHPGVQSRVVSHHDLGGTKGGMSYVMPPSMGDGYPPPSLSDHALSSPMSNGNGRGGNFAYPFGTCPMPPDGGVDCKMSGSRAFSPNPMTGVDPYLDSILNLTGLPTGSGAGYGVGVTDDELLPVSLQLNLSDLGPAPSLPGPPSASLLQDWLDMKMLDPKDMDALQKELESGSQDAFLHSLEEL